jgi:hypothetical protein
MSRTALLLLDRSGQADDLAKAMEGIWVPDLSKNRSYLQQARERPFAGHAIPSA